MVRRQEIFSRFYASHKNDIRTKATATKTYPGIVLIPREAVKRPFADWVWIGGANRWLCGDRRWTSAVSDLPFLSFDDAGQLKPYSRARRENSSLACQGGMRPDTTDEKSRTIMRRRDR